MSSSKQQYEVIDKHLANADLQPNDFAILGVKKNNAKQGDWVRIACAEYIPRDNSNAQQENTPTERHLTIGRGDDRWFSEKIQRVWHSLTIEDIKVEYPDHPAILEAAKMALESESYVLLKDEDGKPIINPTRVFPDDEELRYRLKIIEAHTPFGDIEEYPAEDAAKQTTEGEYFFKYHPMKDENGREYDIAKAIFRDTQIVCGTPKHQLIVADGVTPDLEDLSYDAQASASGLPRLDKSRLKPKQPMPELDQTTKDQQPAPTVNINK